MSFDKQNPEQRRHRYLRRAAEARSRGERASSGVGEQYVSAAQSWEALARTVDSDSSVHSTSLVTIYLVDDDPALRIALRRLFGVRGFTVRDYASGNSLLADLPPTAGCLVLDYDLPGLNGIETLEKARSRGCVLPAIIVTGSPEVVVEELANKAGAFGFFRKPADPNTLLSTVETAILALNDCYSPVPASQALRD